MIPLSFLTPCDRENTLLPLQMCKMRLRGACCFCFYGGSRGWEWAVTPSDLIPSLPGNPSSASLSASFKNLHNQPKDLYFLITLAASSEYISFFPQHKEWIYRNILNKKKWAYKARFYFDPNISRRFPPAHITPLSNTIHLLWKQEKIRVTAKSRNEGVGIITANRQ